MRYALFIVVLFSSFLVSSQLMINEVSQGPSGSQEYVEFVVAGNQTCSTPVPCIDLRGIVLDDNNGYFASGSGTGIASGAIRFATSSFWSCVPQGTLIVIYNSSDINPSIPVDDISLNDGNCRLIIPINSTLLEGQSISPTTSDINYPAAVNWVSGGGAWGQIGMANGGDSFQIRSSISATSPYHAVSWGNNTTNAQISFAGSASMKVYSFTNYSSNDWFQQGNWIAGDAGIDETPGSPNSTQNAQWIAQMNPTCGLGNPLVLNVLESALSCVGDCDGSLVASASGGAGNYVFNWSTGEMTPTITGLCAGTYSVTVTDANGCSITQNATVAQGYPLPNIVINTDSPYLITDSPDQLTATPAGGDWFSNCGTCLSSTGIFNPQIAGAGTFNVCYIGKNGACEDTACTTILVNNCDSSSTYISWFYCEGDSSLWNGNYLFQDTLLITTSISNTGCLIYEFNQLNFDVCANSQVLLPNIFTPNNDGENDVWFPILNNALVESGGIYNRWGEEIHQLTSTQFTWNGKISDTPASEGVYFVRLKVSGQDYQGTIELLR